MRHGVWQLLAAATLALSVLTGAHASGLRVLPLRLDLGGSQKTAELDLINLSTASIVVQIEAVTWSQTDGIDEYESTRDVFFAPPIVTVPGAGQSTVRLRLRARPDALIEKSYRIYAQEVTPPRQAPGSGQEFRLRLGIPLFVAPLKPAAPILTVSDRSDANYTRLVLKNSGTAHVKIFGVDIYPPTVDRKSANPEAVRNGTQSAGGKSWLLPGSTQEWKIESGSLGDASDHWIMVRTNDYAGIAAQGLTPRGWLWIRLGDLGGDAPPQ